MAVISQHEVHVAGNLEEALEFLAEHAAEGWRPLAGGTDVMVGIQRGRERCARWVDLSGVAPELSAIEWDGERVRIGGAATMRALRRSDLLRGLCPLVSEAAGTVGALPIQNRATVAGNIINASPAGDTLPVWLALDAEIELISTRGTRRLPYDGFTTAYRTTQCRPDELLAAVLFQPPPQERTRLLFRKVGTRAAQTISKVVLATVARVDGSGRYEHVRLGFGSMAPVPKRAKAAEEAALGEEVRPDTGQRAAAALEKDLSPIDDLRSSAAYRMRVARNLVREFLAGHLGRWAAG